MAVQSVIRFKVKPDREKDFEAAFHATGMLTRPTSVRGFLGAELLRSLETPTEYYVIGNWASARAYARWQGVSLQDANESGVAALLDTLLDPAPGRLFSAVVLPA